MSQYLDPDATPGEPGPSESAPDEVPTTGLVAVDQAIASLADLDGRPVSQHPEALAAVHETLHHELQSSRAPKPE